MKFLLPLAGCYFALAPLVSAQVSVELALDQDQFLPGESLEVGVRITNFSGQTLHLGKDNDWLRFTIEGRDNYIVPGSVDVPRSEEHTSELQSRLHLVCRLLLEKKKKTLESQQADIAEQSTVS